MLKGSWQASALDSPPDLTTLSSRGYPTSGNPKTGTPATKPGAAWYFLIAQMRLSLLEACGVDPAQPPSTTEYLEALQSFKWAKDKTLSGSVLKDGTISALSLADRSVTQKKLAETIDLKGGGITLMLKTYTTAELSGVVLAKGELALNVETWGLYAGDGATQGGHLIGGDTQAQIVEIREILETLTNSVAKLGSQTQPFTE